MSQRPDFTLVEDQAEYQAMLPVLEASDVIGYDTEFVAEDCYQPDLCLVQLSTRDSIFVVDPKAVDMSAAWDLLVDGERLVIVHAGREETLFVQKATGKSMPRLFDVQVALGLLGGEYPASYGKLLLRILDINVAKGETRTDWRKRPLSQDQLNYAALDVLHLPELYDVLKSQLADQGRLAWLEDEIQARQIALRHFTQQESWVRISGIQSLRSKQLGVARELWSWREERAKSKNMPARRVLRDDLIVELAKRGLTDEKRIAQIRGMHHSGFQRFLPDIARCVRNGLSAPVPEAPWAKRMRRTKPPALLQQFLSAAMSYQCRSHSIASSIVGTTDDVGRLAGYWIDGKSLDEEHDDFPNLLRGWRREFVGDPLRDIFLGRRALRVQDPHNDMPLALCDIDAPE
ncbi:MAG: ribonuclease D [Pirellulaceae bacterium]